MHELAAAQRVAALARQGLRADAGREGEIVGRRHGRAGRDEIVCRLAAQAGEGRDRIVAADELRDLEACLLCLCHRAHRPGAARALHDGLLEQARGTFGREQVHAHARRAGRDAADRHVARVAAERRDVLLHPAQRLALVFERVAAVEVRAERRVRHEAERAEPVVRRDDDEVAFARQVIERIQLGAAADERAAIEPHQHRARLARRRGRHGHVEVQAIFVVARFGEAEAHDLRAGRPVFARIEFARPGRDGSGRFEAQIA